MFSGCVLLFRFHNIQKIVCMSSLILSGHYKFLDLSASFALCLGMNQLHPNCTYLFSVTNSLPVFSTFFISGVLGSCVSDVLFCF